MFVTSFQTKTWPLLIALQLAPQHANGEQHPVVVSTIRIEGLTRTERAVVERELRFSPCETLPQEEIEASVQRLRNTHLFAKVDYQILSRPDSPESEVTFLLEERWTTIPIMKFNQGGGVRQFIIGAYDINLFGKFLEGGAQYERLGQTNSGVLWFRNPRLLGQRLRFAADLWSVNRVRLLYENHGATPNLENGFLHDIKFINLDIEKEFRSWFKGGLGLSLRQNMFSTRYIDKDQFMNPSVNDLPPNWNSTRLTLHTNIGIINRDDYGFVKGTELESSISIESADNKDVGQFTTSENVLRSFWPLPGRGTLALRLGHGATTTDIESQQFFVGGLDRLRGFMDARFRGRTYLLGNFEIRYPSYISRWITIEHNAFYDRGHIGDSFNDLRALDGDSAGVGIRFSSPKVYRLVGRLDYAWPLRGQGQAPLSFGVQQFF